MLKELTKFMELVFMLVAVGYVAFFTVNGFSMPDFTIPQSFMVLSLITIAYWSGTVLS